MSMKKLIKVTFLLAGVAAVALTITAIDEKRTSGSTLADLRLADGGELAGSSLGVVSSGLEFPLRTLTAERMSTAMRVHEVETELLERERALRDIEHAMTPETVLQVEFDFLEPGRQEIEDLQAILSVLRGELTDLDVTIASLGASMVQHDRDLALTTRGLTRSPSFE